MKLKIGFIASTLVLSLVIGVYQVWPRPIGQSWQPASDVAPSKLMEQAAREHLSSSFDGHLGQLSVMKIFLPEQATPLYLIDTRIPSESIYNNPLCGVLGCLFLGYIQTGDGYREVLSVYLNTLLPPDIPFIEAGEIQNDMPELIIHQLDSSELIRLRLALNNNRYEPVETQYLPLSD